MTYILGISGPVSENQAACLLKDGKLIAMAEEERFSRIKHTGKFSYPKEAIDFCLNYAGITIDDVDRIAVGWYSASKTLTSIIPSLIKRPLFLYKIPDVWKHSRIVKNDVFQKRYKDKISYFSHHMSHSGSAYFVSGFNNANILSLDGHGESESTLLGVGIDQKRIKPIKSYTRLDSLGCIYSTVTNYLGFRAHSEEGKIMGLASYGRPVFDFSDLIVLTKKGYKCKQMPFVKAYISRMKNKIDFAKGKQMLLAYYLHKKYGDNRIFGQPNKKQMDMAATVQTIQEQVIIKLATTIYDKNGIKNFCLAGGSNMNCVANGILAEQDFVKDIYVQPASADNGCALGAAYLEYTKNKRSNFIMEHAYFGPEYSNREIEQILKKNRIQFEYREDIIDRVAKLLNDKKIVGWFQGRMEFGARALGNRSILANPSTLEMRDKVNIVKKRELWRPLAPSMLDRAGKEYLENHKKSPFMILSFRVKQDKWKEVPAIVHVDGTTRPQTVTKEANKMYYELISEFEKLSGIPVILNTSFNDRGVPIVCSPQDAIDNFRNMGFDYLAIGNYLIKKS